MNKLINFARITKKYFSDNDFEYVAEEEEEDPGMSVEYDYDINGFINKRIDTKDKIKVKVWKFVKSVDPRDEEKTKEEFSELYKFCKKSYPRISDRAFKSIIRHIVQDYLSLREYRFKSEFLRFTEVINKIDRILKYCEGFAQDPIFEPILHGFLHYPFRGVEGKSYLGDGTVIHGEDFPIEEALSGAAHVIVEKDIERNLSDVYTIIKTLSKLFGYEISNTASKDMEKWLHYFLKSSQEYKRRHEDWKAGPIVKAKNAVKRMMAPKKSWE